MQIDTRTSHHCLLGHISEFLIESSDEIPGLFLAPHVNVNAKRRPRHTLISDTDSVQLPASREALADAEEDRLLPQVVPLP